MYFMWHREEEKVAVKRERDNEGDEDDVEAPGNKRARAEGPPFSLLLPPSSISIPFYFFPSIINKDKMTRR